MAGDDKVGWELKDGRLVCLECWENCETDEAESPICYYHAKAEEPCDECGIRLDGGETDDLIPYDEAWPERPHDTAAIGMRRSR